MPRPPRVFTNARHHVPVMDAVGGCRLLIVRTGNEARWLVVECDGWGAFCTIGRFSSLNDAKRAARARLDGRTPRVGRPRWPDVKLPSHRPEVTP